MDDTDDREITKDPTLSDFYNDMNEHGGADYKKVGSSYVVEIDTNPSGAWVTVWKAVEHPTREGYAPPDGKEGNRYAWEAKGRAEFEDMDEARAEFVRLGSGNRREFCQSNPYEGPRSPYNERVES